MGRPQARRHPLKLTSIFVKRIFTALLGGALLLIGLAMVVLPGPAVIVIPVALKILATEFAWAGRSLEWLCSRFKSFSRDKTSPAAAKH